MRPFQNEGPERSRFVGASHGKRRPFADEAAEVEKPTISKKKLKSEASSGKPFQDEASEESSDSNDDPDSNPFLPKTESVFSLGWQTVHSFQKATAWDRHQKEEDKKQKDMKKRAYDNSKRSAAAKEAGNFGHPRKVFESRGKDSDRVNKLINLHTCSCA